MLANAVFAWRAGTLYDTEVVALPCTAAVVRLTGQTGEQPLLRGSSVQLSALQMVHQLV